MLGSDYKAPKGYEWLEGFIPSGGHVVVTNISLPMCTIKKGIPNCERIYLSEELGVFRHKYYYEENIPNYDIYIVWNAHR